MVFLCECTCLNVIAVLVAVLTVIRSYFKWSYKHWERCGLPYIKPSIPFGTMGDIFLYKKSFGEQMAEHYKTAKAKGYKHIGYFGFARPEYMPVDAEMLKNVLVKDFNNFCDRGFYVNEEIDPLSGHLFCLGGNKWRKMRTKLTPTFTSGKIKMMLNIILECGQQLKQAIETECEHSPINVKAFLECYGVDVIGSSAFGLNCNSFKDPNSNFCKKSKRFFNHTLLEDIIGLSSIYFPYINRFFNVPLIPKDVSSFFLNTTRETVEYRKKNKVLRNDFMQILIDLMESGSGLTIEEVAAQTLTFFIAGFETSSTVMMFCLFELALNEEIQEKLREEINAVMENHNQEITYECLKEMAYMQQVLDEVMRKYPPLPVLNRMCTVDYKLPNTEIVLKKGTAVTVPVLGIQNDPEYFPNPEKFDPQRFTPTNRDKMSPFTYMPFGDGPRSCLGIRFAYLQMKVALTMLMQNFRFSLNEKTQLPLKLNPRQFISTPLGHIWLNVKKV